MDIIQTVRSLLESHFKDAHIEIGDLTGAHNHLELLVASDLFKGKMLIDQHQMIMDVLKELLKGKLHAVKIKTMTKEKYLESKKS
jgi:stress-induced morphogen